MSNSKSKDFSEKTTNIDVPLEREEHNVDSGFLSGPLSEELHSDNLSSNISSNNISEQLDSGLGLGIEKSISNLSLSNRCNNFNEPPRGNTLSLNITTVSEKSNSIQGSNTDLPSWELLFQQDDDGDTQLHIAAIRGCRASVNTLIKVCPAPALLNICNDFGETPLHLAVAGGHAVITRMLITAGAQVSYRDCAGETPLHVASTLGDNECLVALLAPLPSQPLRYHASVLDQKNYNGETCVHQAVKRGHKDILHTLVWYGANINAREGLAGYTPLHLAAESGDVDMTTYLLDHFSKYLNLSTESYGGKTARRLARKTTAGKVFARIPLQQDEYFDDEDSEEESDVESDDDDMPTTSSFFKTNQKLTTPVTS